MPSSFAEPAFCFGSDAAGDQVGVDLVETFEHDGLNVEHGAADAGMLVLAGRGVRTPALSELDFALVEVDLELVPLRGGDRPVFPGGAAARRPARCVW